MANIALERIKRKNPSDNIRATLRPVFLQFQTDGQDEECRNDSVIMDKAMARWTKKRMEK
ncbi:hypothetical protein HMPREF1870_00626 [Bacteroidales bacterium KA00344]|nr:hypothetical protein HMPREF1870_00626 [Bacteroidales bacterium KA00344]